MKNIQAFMKFAGTLNPEQFTAFMALIGVSGASGFQSDPAAPGFGRSTTVDPAESPGADVCRCDDLFETGDVVVIASGGPAMTISDIEDTHAVVMWFDDDDDLCERRVPLAVLEHAPPSPVTE